MEITINKRRFRLEGRTVVEIRNMFGREHKTTRGVIPGIVDPQICFAVWLDGFIKGGG